MLVQQKLHIIYRLITTLNNMPQEHDLKVKNTISKKKIPISGKIFYPLLLSSNIIFFIGLYNLFFGEDWVGIFFLPVPLLMIGVNVVLFLLKEEEENIKLFVLLAFALTISAIMAIAGLL